MSANVWTVLVTALVSVGSTLVAVFYGPTWKDRVEAKRALQQRSEDLLARYSEPLARAAFDLQSRLYNISRKWFMTGSDTPDEYRRLSSLWLLGQFLGWVEIVRREVQIIDYGEVRRTAELQRHLFDVADILSSNSVRDDTLRVFRAEQRAIGELMVTERLAADVRRSDSMGYAEFVQRMETDPAFGRWFTRLSADLDTLMQGARLGMRPILVQRALIDLIDFFDPQSVRFPDPNERGKIPLLPEYQDRKRLRPVSEVARFRFDGDPLAVVEVWAKGLGLTVRHTEGAARALLPRRLTRRHDVAVMLSAPWVEVHVVARGRPVDPGRIRSNPRENLTRAEVDALNALLRLFDRPVVPQRANRLARPTRTS